MNSCPSNKMYPRLQMKHLQDWNGYIVYYFLRKKYGYGSSLTEVFYFANYHHKYNMYIRVIHVQFQSSSSYCTYATRFSRECK